MATAEGRSLSFLINSTSTARPLNPFFGAAFDVGDANGVTMMRCLFVLICTLCMSACATNSATERASASPQSGCTGCTKGKDCKGAKQARQKAQDAQFAQVVDHVWPQRW